MTQKLGCLNWVHFINCFYFTNDKIFDKYIQT